MSSKDEDTPVRRLLLAGQVIPVLVIDQLASALPLARALLAGGLSVLEVTLRTPVAWRVIERLLGEIDGAAVGAGTVSTAADLSRLARLGARFAVSPGLTPTLLAAARDEGVPLLPGVMTTSELMLGREGGLSEFKFFPAEAAGGPELLTAWGGPFPEVGFCPTGGVSPESAPSYFKLANVLAVGTSWVAPRDLVQAGRWEEIERRAVAARSWAAL